MAEELRLLTLDEIVEEYYKVTTVGFSFVGTDDNTGYLLFEFVTALPDGSERSEVFLAAESMDDIGFAIFGEDYLLGDV